MKSTTYTQVVEHVSRIELTGPQVYDLCKVDCSALVTYYSSGDVILPAHADDEPLFHTSSIAAVSLGGSHTIHFTKMEINLAIDLQNMATLFSYVNLEV